MKIITQAISDIQRHNLYFSNKNYTIFPFITFIFNCYDFNNKVLNSIILIVRLGTAEMVILMFTDVE